MTNFGNIAAAIALVVMAPVDVDTDFANQLHW